MKVAKDKGRLRGKQPKLKPTRLSTCWSCTTSARIPKPNWPNSSASADRRCTGPSSGSDPSHQYPSGHSQISPIIKGEPATRGPRVNQRPAGRAAEGPYRVRRAPLRRASRRLVRCVTVTGRSRAAAWEKPALRSGGLPARGSKPLPAIMKSGQPRPKDKMTLTEAPSWRTRAEPG